MARHFLMLKFTRGSKPLHIHAQEIASVMPGDAEEGGSHIVLKGSGVWLYVEDPPGTVLEAQRSALLADQRRIQTYSDLGPVRPGPEDPR